MLCKVSAESDRKTRSLPMFLLSVDLCCGVVCSCAVSRSVGCCHIWFKKTAPSLSFSHFCPCQRSTHVRESASPLCKKVTRNMCSTHTLMRCRRSRKTSLFRFTEWCVKVRTCVSEGARLYVCVIVSVNENERRSGKSNCKCTHAYAYMQNAYTCTRQRMFRFMSVCSKVACLFFFLFF